MDKSMRLDRFLADMAVGTRSQVKEMARQGRIQVNGATVKKADTRIEPGRDVVFCDGQRIDYAKNEYYMLNKPQGVVSATEDNLHETVLDVIRKNPPRTFEGDGIEEGQRARGPRRKDLFPVGRLDIDTQGLLLITNDGDLAHRLLSPKCGQDVFCESGRAFARRRKGAVLERDHVVRRRGAHACKAGDRDPFGKGGAAGDPGGTPDHRGREISSGEADV